MAEGVNALAVDIGHGAVGGDAEIARKKLDADHRAGLEIGGVAHGGGIDFGAGADGLPRLEPEGPQLGRERIEGGLAEAAEGNGRRDIDEASFTGHDGPRPGERASEVGGREVEGGAGARGRGGHIIGGPDHFLYRAYAGDGVLGERKRHGDGAGELSIDIDRAAAHALHDAGVLEGTSGESREDEGFLGAEVIEHAQDFDLKLLDAIAVEDGAPDAVHSGANVLEGKERSLGGKDRGQGEGLPGGLSGAHLLL